MARTRTVLSLSAQLVVLALIATAFFMRTSPVAGLSMEPRVHAGELVLINTLAYRFGPLRRGDVIAFRHDAPNPETYIKRVVGLPGERVEVREGIVSIDGRALPEPYVRFRDRRSAPPSSCRRMRATSSATTAPTATTRATGACSTTATIVGKAIVGIWPPRRL